MPNSAGGGLPFRRRWLVRVACHLAAGVTAGVGTLVADVALHKRDADQFQRKVQGINRYALLATTAPRRTSVTESEINAYLAFHARDQIPAGVVDPYISIVGTGRLRGRAVIDLDAVSRRRGAGGLLDPLSYLSGHLPISATGVLQTENGVGRFQLESAELSGIAVPKVLLQELVSQYSRTPERPQGLSLDDPFVLPARIREIEVGRGHAVIVQ